jgi:hypothetical protein
VIARALRCAARIPDIPPFRDSHQQVASDNRKLEMIQLWCAKWRPAESAARLRVPPPVQKARKKILLIEYLATNLPIKSIADHKLAICLRIVLATTERLLNHSRYKL